jgi:tetratricopeptide (TPR) repeat protein
MQSLGMILISSKRMDEADQIFKRLTALPDNAFRPVHALFLHQFGNRDEAIKEFEALAKADPSDRTSRTRLVAAYFTAGRIPDATKVLTEALKRNPKDTDALLQRAEMRLKAGSAEDAASDVKQVLSLNPDSAIGHVLSAKVYLAQGLTKNQQDELHAAIRLNPSLLAARIALATSFLSGGQAKAALGVMDETPANQKTDYSALLTRNWVLLAMGNLTEAAPGVQKTLGVRSQEAVYQAAVLHYLQKDYAGVRVLVDELLKRGDTDPWIPQLMMDAYAAQRESSKGLERLKDISAAHPGSAPLHHLLGQWLVRAGDTAAGRKAFEKAAEVDPAFVQAKLSMAQLDLDQGHVEVARQNLKSFLQTQPANVEALLLAARADISSGDRPSVIARYHAVLAIDNSNVIALNNLAYMLLAEKPDEALKFAQMAVERSPESAFAQDTLGWVYFRKGLYTMAVPHLQTAVEKEPTARRQFHLGMCYIKAGEQTKGQNIVNRALQKEPTLSKTELVW